MYTVVILNKLLMLKSTVLPKVLPLKYTTTNFHRFPQQITIKFHKTEYN